VYVSAFNYVLCCPADHQDTATIDVNCSDR